MSKLKAAVRYQFCAGHRIMGHENKCANLHGHNYVAFFHAEIGDGSEGSLDKLGRVIDFSVLKSKMKEWIDTNWDHTMILYEKDAQTIEALKSCEWNKPVFLLNKNPTAENMARYLLEEVCPKVLEGTGVKVSKVVLWETENCYVEVEL